MPNQDKIENLLKELPLLRKIDLNLSRINRLNKDLKINFNRLRNKTTTICGTNGKWSNAIFLSSIFEAAGYKIDLFTSPHVQFYTERFIFESKEISEESLFNLLSEVGSVNGNKPITVFEFLTSSFYYYSALKSKSDLVIAENGLFNKFDSVSSIGHHLMKIITSISQDHLDWLPEGKKNIDQIIIEKTSNINSSNIIVAEQSENKILDKIEYNIKNNPAKKSIFSKNYTYEINKDGFLYKDEFGSLQLPNPALPGIHQISNAACVVAAIRKLKKYNIKEEHIINGIKSIKNMRGRLEVIKKGPIKTIAPSNTIICDIAHNPSAGQATSKYLDSLDKNKKIYLICGMMNNKIHDKFISNFKQVEEIVAVNITNNKNCIKKEKLKEIVEKIGIKAKTKNSIQDAIKYIASKDPKSTILITGSIYLFGEVSNLND